VDLRISSIPIKIGSFHCVDAARTIGREVDLNSARFYAIPLSLIFYGADTAIPALGERRNEGPV